MRRLMAAAAVLMLVATACGDDEGGVKIEEAWARNSASMATAGAVYMQLTSADGDTLLSVAVDASIAREAQIHEVVPVDMSEDGDMGEMSEEEGGMDMGGAMRMQEVASIALPAGETVSLQPGGYHVMLMDLAEPLEVGQKFTVTLRFETAGDIEVEVEVREEAP